VARCKRAVFHCRLRRQRDQQALSNAGAVHDTRYGGGLETRQSLTECSWGPSSNPETLNLKIRERIGSAALRWSYGNRDRCGQRSQPRPSARLAACARGANVVVNDIGALPAALGYPGIASAEAVAAEIRALGGKAAADTNSVATEEGAPRSSRPRSMPSQRRHPGQQCGHLPRRLVRGDDPADFRQNDRREPLRHGPHLPRRLAAHEGAVAMAGSSTSPRGSLTGLAWQTAYAAARARSSRLPARSRPKERSTASRRTV